MAKKRSAGTDKKKINRKRKEIPHLHHPQSETTCNTNGAESTSRQKGFPHYAKGKFEITRSGVGYVIIPDQEGDVLVRPGRFNTALNGDIVRVKIERINPRNKRKEGVIDNVEERKRTEFLGTIRITSKDTIFIPDGDKQMPCIYIPKSEINDACNNDRVVVRLTKWEKGSNSKPVGKVIKIMQPEDVNDMAMNELLTDSGFPIEFNKEVLNEADSIPEVLDIEEIAKREDCRNILTCTIDPADAKDFDDALSIRKIEIGVYEIGVHIADVSYYVQPETALDIEAYFRATSVYLPDRVNPMLPEKISNELCSLRPNEDKFTFSAIFQIDENATVKNYRLGRTVIHSDHRFTYEEVQDIIDKKEGKYCDEILLFHHLAQTLRKKRFEKGAINFSSQEVRFKLDEKGKPVSIEIKESKESHQLIEEFMLLANKTVAEHVSKIKVHNAAIPFPYRIHDTPGEDKLKPFMEFAKRYGHTFDTKSPEKIAQSFNRMLVDVQGKPEQHVLEQLGIRTMAKAIYTTENIGHYGLGFDNYCHFTSPIRRYPDVMTHRILQSCINKAPVVDKKMEEKCKHSSDRERAAMECERASNKYKQVEYMQNFLGEDFEGVISGVSSFGFWVETIAHKCEGLVSVTSLSEYDDFRLNETDYALYGRRSGRKFGIGDKVWIKVVAANLERRQLDYEWKIKEAKSEKEKIKSEK